MKIDYARKKEVRRQQRDQSMLIEMEMSMITIARELDRIIMEL